MNLNDQAELFLASQRLKAVAGGLESLANGTPVDKNDAANFEWAKHLIGEISHQSIHYREHLELQPIATKLRPFYYQTVKEMGATVPDLADKIYTTLDMYERHVTLTKRELQQARTLYDKLATSILLSIPETKDRD